MPGLSDYTADATLNWLAGSLAMPALAARYLALFTAVGSDSGAGFTEVSGGSYARVQIGGSLATSGTTSSGATLNFSSVPAWIVAGMLVRDATTSSVIPAATTVLSTTGTTVVMSANVTGGGVGSGDTIVFSAFAAASGSGPSTLVSNAIIAYPQATASWGTVIAIGEYDALTSGNLTAWDYLGNYAWQPCYITSASPGVFSVASNYSAADPIVYTIEYGGTAPTFSQSNLTGVLAVVSPSGSIFTVTNASTAVNTSSVGSGMVRKITQQPIAANVTASFASGQLTLVAA